MTMTLTNFLSHTSIEKNLSYSMYYVQHVLEVNFKDNIKWGSISVRLVE